MTPRPRPRPPRGAALLVAMVLLSVVDRVVVLDHGAVIFQGTAAEAQQDARVAEVYLGPPEARAA